MAISYCNTEDQWMIDKMEVVRRLRAAMKHKRVKNVDIARACKISEQAVGLWFKAGNVSKNNLAIAAALCDVTIDSLLTDNLVMKKLMEPPDDQFRIIGPGMNEIIDQDAVDIALAWKGLSESTRRLILRQLQEEVSAQSEIIRKLNDNARRSDQERANKVIEAEQQKMRAKDDSKIKK